MNMKKRLIGTGLVLATGILLTACGQSNTDTSTFSSTFSANPTTFNYLLDYYADNTSVITNLVDGLLENDSYGNLTPALAEDWSVSADGLTYTYKLRKDAKWYTADGEEYDSTRVVAKINLKVGDDYKTLRFLAQPDGDFLYIGPERF